MTDTHPSPAADDMAADRDIEFGMKAIEASYVQPLHLQSALRKLNERRTLGDRTSLPQILLEIGLMTKEQVKDVLSALSATSLVCTNPSCGESYKVKAFDPGRKYKCAKCKSPLHAENPEDAGELTGGGGFTVSGVDELQKQIAEFYDISDAAPPPPPEMINLHAPRQRGDTSIRLAGEAEEQINLEDDPRAGLSKHKPLSGEIGTAGLVSIAGVPVGRKTPAKKQPGDDRPDTIAGIPIASGDAHPDADAYGFYSGDMIEAPAGLAPETHVAGPVGAPAAGVPVSIPGVEPVSESATAVVDEPEPAGKKPGRKPAKAKPAAREKKPKNEKKPKAPRRGPHPALIALIVLVLLGGVGAGGYYLYLQLTADTGRPPLPIANRNSNIPASAQQRQIQALQDARAGLKALATDPRPIAELVAEVDKLIQKAPQLMEGQLFAGGLLWRSGDTDGAMARWNAVIDADPLPGGMEEPVGVRDEAGFMVGLALLLDEERCDPSAARRAFAQVLERTKAGPSSSGDRPVVAACRALAAPVDEALQSFASQSAATSFWQVRLARGLLLASGAWPGELPHTTDNYDEATQQLRLALAEPAATTVVQVRAFHGLLMGAMVSDPRDQSAAEEAIAAATRDGALTQTAAYYRARIAFANNDTAAASALLKDIALPRATLLRGRIAMLARDGETARELLGSVREKLPEARMLLGRLALEMGAYSNAAVLLADATTPMALADLGLARILSGDAPAAVLALKKAVELREASSDQRKNENAVVYARYAYALHAAGDANGSRLAERSAVAADRNHPELLLWRGTRELDNGHPLAAMDDIGRLTEREPGLWRGWLVAGKCLLELGKKAEAAAALEKAQSLCPVDARERDEIARLLQEAQ